MKKAELNRLPDLFERINKTQALYLPVETAIKSPLGVSEPPRQVNFEAWHPEAKVNLEAIKTVKSPKEFFLPPCQKLYSAKVNQGELSITPHKPDNRPFVIFGIRPCDTHALDVLDDTYLSEPIDKFYEAKRTSATLISLACQKPGITCFCNPFDIDAAHPPGDISAWIVGAHLFLRANTEKGEVLTAALGDLLSDFDETDRANLLTEQANIREKINALPYSNLPIKNIKPENLMKFFASESWNESYKACIACGTCTFLCPTCHCYDISDVGGGNESESRRTWDSCMYPDFTEMAHGNPRPTQKERFRQRFMHKLVYHPQTFGGEYGCIGCGRCVNKCPVNLNIVKIINTMGGEDYVRPT